jgi:hypothetical protein
VAEAALGASADPPKPFDFLVNGELLRGTLEEAVLAGNVSAERVLEVEYLLAVLPPNQKQELPHADWCVHAATHPLPPPVLYSLFLGILSHLLYLLVAEEYGTATTP